MANKKDVVVSRGDASARAEIEARRGIVRDSEGRIIRDAKWKKARIAHLEEKIETFAQRTKNAKAEIKTLQA